MPSPLNILRVITWLPVGGIERRLVATLPRLDRSRFRVQLVCIRERGPLADELERAGVPVHLIPFRKRWDISAIRRLAALIREEKVDIVHSHMYRANVPATVAARLAGVRRVWGQVHNVGTWETPRQAAMDRWLCRWRQGMIAVSEEVRRDVMATLRLPAERVEVIYNGVDIERFRGARARREAVRRRERVEDRHLVFIFAARLVEQKRAQDFLAAFGRLQAQPGGGDLRAWVLGGGPLDEPLRARAAGLPNPEAVKFFGRRDDVEDFLAAADVFVLPSTKEGFSNAVIEAMAAGLPVVASAVGGNPEAVRDGIEGRIVAPLKVDELASAMESLWRNPQMRAEQSAAAAQRAETFSLDRMTERLESFYLGLMA